MKFLTALLQVLCQLNKTKEIYLDSFVFQELQTERLFRREPQYEALQGERLDQPALVQKYEVLQGKWENVCRRLEDRQKRLVAIILK